MANTKEITIVVTCRVHAAASDADVVKAVQKMLEIGQGDALDTCDDEEMDRDDICELAASLDIVSVVS